METAWAWILTYVLAFGVFQYVLYRYLQREEDRVGPGVGDTGETAPAHTSPTDAPEVIRCSACGASNEAVGSYRFCRECLAELPRYRR
ncbi:MAG: DUF7577 domain-containing protein [Halococcoides sp.]